MPQMRGSKSKFDVALETFRRDHKLCAAFPYCFTSENSFGSQPCSYCRDSIATSPPAVVTVTSQTPMTPCSAPTPGGPCVRAVAHSGRHLAQIPKVSG